MRGRTVNLDDTEPIAAWEHGLASNKPLGTGTVPIQDSATEAPPSSGANALSKGDIVDRYRVIRLIASGGMARVYEAVHVFTKKSVALKVMHQRLADRKDLVERFRHEAIALSSIQHRNVVNVNNAGLTDDGHVFIAMDLLSGHNLRQVLQMRKRLELSEALRITRDVAEGVAAAHDVKIIHRDLKPENVVRLQNGAVKVLDLGTAKFAGDNAPTTQTAFGKVVGTAAYIAPERLDGEPGDERCDVYSLGLMLCECITGVHPMVPTGQSPSAAEIASRQITYNPRPIPGLPTNVWNLIAKAIHKKPEMRFQTMHELRSAVAVALNQLERDETTPARSSSSWAGLALPVLAGIIVGSGATTAAVRLRHGSVRDSAGAVAALTSVPSNQTEESSAIDPTVPVLMQPASVAQQPTSATAAATVSARVVGVSPVKPGVAARGEPRPSTSAKRTYAGAAIVPNSAVPKPSRDDLPASGL